MKMNVLNTKYIEKRRKMIIKRVTIGFKIRLKANVNLTIENYIYKNPYISLFYVLCKRDSIVLINSIVTNQKIQSPFPYDSVIKSHMFSE